MQTIRNLFIGNSISPPLVRHDFILIALVLTSLALLATARAQLNPAPDGAYPNQNTAEGEDALFSLTTGTDNTAIGFNALHSLATGSEATATGSLALFNDTTGFNTAYGFNALYGNTTGFANTAIGRNAMANHITGDHNTATGGAALFSNADGTGNTATGRAAMGFGTTGSQNTATGWQTLFNNTGDSNTANGAFALYSNTTGNSNTADGFQALYNNTSGEGNIALGNGAGFRVTTGSNNIDIGAYGTANDSNTIRIGRTGTQKSTFIAGISGVAVTGRQVVVNANGKLGITTSSLRFKDAIKPMNNASETILALEPVTFRYKQEFDPDGIPQFGLIAEQVEKVDPNLVARDGDGKVNAVRYEAVNAMLLNEFLKQHRKVDQQEATIAKQQKQIEALTSGLQKVSNEFELSKPAPQSVSNNQ
jgi:Chaperone of endosialidase